MNIIENMTYDNERALYNIKDTLVKGCTFAGPADGESVLKETRSIVIDDCSFSLRYPIWHAKKYELRNSRLDEKTRASLWYSDEGIIENTEINGVKALRECCGTVINNCKIDSVEFGWKTADTRITHSSIVSEYIFLDAKRIDIDHLDFKGKYSFQYVEDLVIKNSYLDTKDAFWHAKNVTVTDSVVKGEYLAWFSEGLTLIRCKIIGTQPLCYCKGLKLIDCEMENCDLAFEYSEVEADVKGHIDSVKNPKSGRITADSIGELIYEDSIMPSEAEVIVRNK
ncbi:DUF3737 family protein [Ruminococcus sp.]|uniref:DUF3737 family protein n=1 Tax=Ruminococcus sp. TaxID=41978 RepID=UPI0025CD68FD|nr:DUF3737 family protein [Ruminococcus sp.]MBQ8966103.1 DUF3737 family protein [Ruminococcus sp.]